MKKQNIAITIIMAFALMMVLPMISAQTMSTPVANGNYTKSLTVTIAVPASPAITNITCYQNSSGGVAATRFLQILNTTTAQTSFTGVGTLTTESSTYNISCNVYNGTTLNATVGATGITIDGTNPVVTVSADSPQISRKRPITFTWAATDTHLYTTVGTLTSPDSNKCPTLTLNTGATGTQTIQDAYTDCAGTWTATLVGTDYSGNTASATTTFLVTSPDGKFIGETSSLGSHNNNNSDNTWLVVVVVIIILVLVFRKK